MLEPREEDLPELRFSKETHVVPKSIQNYTANRAKELSLSEEGQSIPAGFEPDVWRLVCKHANNAHDMSKMNVMLRLLFA